MESISIISCSDQKNLITKKKYGRDTDEKII
jgi:hypothetical protein